jgi:hypothetical protein
MLLQDSTGPRTASGRKAAGIPSEGLGMKVLSYLKAHMALLAHSFPRALRYLLALIALIAHFFPPRNRVIQRFPRACAQTRVGAQKTNWVTS